MERFLGPARPAAMGAVSSAEGCFFQATYCQSASASTDPQESQTEAWSCSQKSSRSTGAGTSSCTSSSSSATRSSIMDFACIERYYNSCCFDTLSRSNSAPRGHESSSDSRIQRRFTTRHPGIGPEVYHQGEQVSQEGSALRSQCSRPIQRRPGSCYFSTFKPSLLLAYLPDRQPGSLPNLWARLCEARERYAGPHRARHPGVPDRQREIECCKRHGHQGPPGCPVHLRRGGCSSGCAHGESRQDCSMPFNIDHQLGRSQVSGGRACQGRAEEQASSAFWTRRYRGLGWRGLQACAFYLGRCDMTTEYAHQWPSLAVQGMFPETLQWNHSVNDEDDFKPLWTAVENAAMLAYELGHSALSVNPVSRSQAPLKTARVHYLDEVQVCIGDAGSLQMACATMSQCSFSKWSSKPWSLKSSLSSRSRQVWTWPEGVKPCVAVWRREDGEDRLDIASSSPSDPFNTVPLPDGHPDQAPVPDFTDNIVARLGDRALPSADDPHVFLEIRTWYLHHVHAPHCDRPRIVVLAGGQPTWIQQLIDAWHDRVLPGIPLATQIATPDPPRSADDQFVALDIVLSQGLEEPMYSSVITTCLLDVNDGQSLFHEAHSLPRVLGGAHIIEVMDLDHLCGPQASRTCHVYHGWTELPLTHDPIHRMRSGHSFLVAVHPERAATADSVPVQGEAAPAETALSAEFSDFLQDMESSFDEDQPDGSDGSDGYEPGTPGPDADDDFNLFNCHVYRLHHPPLHIYLHHVHGVPLLRELARRLGVPTESLVDSHTIQTRMAGQEFDDWSFIVQHVDDMPIASTDKLVILDLEVHFHTPIGALPPLPAFTRRVVRMVQHVTRATILRYAGVYQYCTVQHDRCLVMIDGVGWPILRPGPRLLQHGTYLKVIVPPPFDSADDTLQAIQTTEQYVASLMESPPPARRPRLQTGPSAAAAPYGTLPEAPAPRWWLADLRQAFEVLGATECEEEGPVLYAAVWFLDTVRAPVCRAPKFIRLVADAPDWMRTIIEPWLRDGPIDMHFPYKVHLVNPTPPRASVDGHSLHLIIEQNPIAPKSAALLTFQLQDDHVDRMWQSAYSIPAWVATEELLEIMEVQPLCETRRCTASSGTTVFKQFVRSPVESGASIEIQAFRPRLCPSDPHASSSTLLHVPRVVHRVQGTSLMQRHVWRRIVNGQVHDPVAPGCHDMASSSNEAPPFAQIAQQQPQVYHLPPPAEPQNWRTLQQVWRHYFARGALPWATLTAEVWFIDPHLVPRCVEPRYVRLGHDFLQWPSRLLQSWEDHREVHLPVEFAVVCPTAPGGLQEVQFQVVITQQPIPQESSVVVAAFLDSAWFQDPTLVAVSVPNTVDLHTVQQAADLVSPSPSSSVTWSISWWIDGDFLPHQGTIDVVHGTCIGCNLISETIASPEDDPAHLPDESDMVLLQLRTLVSRTWTLLEPLLEAHGSSDNVALVLDSQQRTCERLSLLSQSIDHQVKQILSDLVPDSGLAPAEDTTSGPTHDLHWSDATATSSSNATFGRRSSPVVLSLMAALPDHPTVTVDQHLWFKPSRGGAVGHCQDR